MILDEYTEQIGDNLRIELHADEDAESPRDWDNLTTIRGWHRRMDIGDGPNLVTWAEDSGDWDELRASIESDEGPLCLFAPLYWYEHSGVSCKMGPNLIAAKSHDPETSLQRFRAMCMDDAGWDSGVAGIVYVTEKSRANMGTDLADVEQVARSEVETYDSYIRGECYGYVISLVTECDHGDEHSDTLESCWGYIGDSDYALSEARASVGHSIALVLRHVLTGSAD